VTLPNLISLGRLCAVPVTLWLILARDLDGAFWLFVAAALSDGVDGFIARYFHRHSKLGAILDPLADKALLVGTYVTLGMMALLPVYLVALVVLRDLAILAGFGVLYRGGFISHVRPLVISKINTLLQILLAAVMLFRRGHGESPNMLEQWLVLIVAGSTVLSGLAYLAQWRNDTNLEGVRKHHG
jgi:cardiolipin synthase